MRWFVSLLLTAQAALADPIVIAHRGASAYVPEHTLAAVAMAHAQGADYIEQDVVLTKDEVPIVLHDITLDHTTDVARRFPGRNREDGHFYAIDFTLAEIKQLRVGERRRENGQAYFEDRFPVDARIFRVPTLEEELQLIRGLNASTGREAGIYVELKQPKFHAQHDMEIAASVLQQLYAYGYRKREHRAYLQCFDASTLRLLKDHTQLKLVQLVRDRDLSESRAREIAGYADGVGPWIGDLEKASDFVVYAQEAGLEVHPFTFRADDVPAGYANFDALLETFVEDLQVDGLFTDHPDLALRYLRGRR